MPNSSSSRPTNVIPSSNLRQPNAGSTSSQQSSALAARITAKRDELENLKQLRDLSAILAKQMGVLEEKLATLKDGTEAVACVLANWDHVLRAITMASGGFAIPALVEYPRYVSKLTGRLVAKIPRPTSVAGDGEPAIQELPITLVRIPAKAGNLNDHVQINGNEQ